MKKLRLILLGALIVGLVLLLWHWQSPRSTRESTGATSPAAPVSVDKPQTPLPTPPPTQSSTEGATAPQANKREQMRSLLGAVNHKAIEFYGKVVDQQGAPLPDVDVYASVIYNSGLSAGMDKKQTKTDAAGLFSISGMKGRTLGIGLDKDGYEYGGDQGPFQFTEMVAEAERYHPDKRNPIVFRMWKLQGAEPLIYFERRAFKLPSDGTPVRIDLATGKKVASGGDLIVTLQQPMAQPGQWLHHYAWNAELKAGGLMESTDALMYLAPEDGYRASLVYGEKGDERLQNFTINKRFYLKTADGRYARVKMDLTSQTNPDHPSTIGLIWWLNPTPGHRNLEFDPAKTITPRP
jgi:hypothetical protein